jgi:hypothetical protein
VTGGLLVALLEQDVPEGIVRGHLLPHLAHPRRCCRAHAARYPVNTLSCLCEVRRVVFSSGSYLVRYQEEEAG